MIILIGGTLVLLALLLFRHSRSTTPTAPVVDDSPSATGQTSPTKESQQSLTKPNVIPLGGSRYRLGLVEIDKAKRSLTVPATVLMRQGAVEYLLVTRHGKVHESIFVTDVDPQDLHLAALLLGIKPSNELGPLDSQIKIPQSSALQCHVEWDRNGPPARIHLHEAIALAPSGETEPMEVAPATLWLYNGSRVQQDGTFVARREGSLISIIRDPAALINYPNPTRDNDEAHLPNAAALPKLDHPVRIVMKAR